jgi:hypothetical protein
MSKKTIARPDSDTTARKHTNTAIGKSGKHSAVEKLAASRSDFDARASAGPVPGAHGKPAKKSEQTSSSKAHREKAARKH